ncbi:hypothetical protein OH76DRAFT_1424002 [Lentinus brumalis]|uniref:Uncharacterized protein n=1 Tax=Lentinus brumalis TaxID=2498619 RepID=A0A371CI56_9APHY|nr:hypothetical protein OH76DRAFT_1424002 [Polyporus brumalis]
MYAPIWEAPNEHVDFELLQGAVFKTLGLLSKAWFAPIDRLVDDIAREVEEFAKGMDTQVLHLRRTMLDARDRILHFPSTFCDACIQTRTVQRFWLMCCAYIDFTRLTLHMDSDIPVAVDARFMGAFTTHPAVAQCLYRAGIPVWDEWNLDALVVDAIVVTEQPKVMCEPLESGASPIYSGLVGMALLQAVSRRAHLYLDVSRALAYPVPKALRSILLCMGDMKPEVGIMLTLLLVEGVTATHHTTHLIPVTLVGVTNQDLRSARRPYGVTGFLSLGYSLGRRTSNERVGTCSIGCTYAQRGHLLAHPEARVTRVPPQWWRNYLNGDIEGATPGVWRPSGKCSFGGPFVLTLCSARIRLL